MRQMTGDLWKVDADVRCVTTNGMVKKNGLAVMGKGIALQATKRYPTLAADLALRLQTTGNHTYYFPPDVITFPTKGHWSKPSTIELITSSAYELVELADEHEWDTIVMPPPGCGNGGLSWKDVAVVLGPILDDRFIVIHYS